VVIDVNDFLRIATLLRREEPTMVENPVRAALVGAGLVGQVAHLHTLTQEDSPIRLAGVVDASMDRATRIAEAHSVPAATSLDALDAETLDAVVIAAPDPAHEVLVLRALELGLHVFSEKPLGLTTSECERMVAAARASGLVCQAGYMKRFDPVGRLLLDDLAARDSRLTGIGVEIRDCDAAPFVSEFPFVPAGDDIPEELIQDGQARFAEVAKEVLGRDASVEERTAYGSFTSSIIHDLNFARLLVPGDVTVETGFMSMGGAHVGLHLRTPDGVLIRMSHTQDATIADYEERFTIYTTKGVYELVFPAPYLLHETTTLRRIDVKDQLEHSEILMLNDSTDEAFILELHAFAQAIRENRSAPLENSFEDASEDIRLLGTAMRMAAGTE
jgi:predicted dehydrogenase